MSGRKSAEVATVLEQSQKSREETRKSVESILLSAQTEVVQRDGEARISLDNIDRFVITATSAEKEFPEDLENLKKRMRECKLRAREARGEGNPFDVLMAQWKRLESDLAKADHRAREIRDIISRKNWYCDDEYKEAQKLAKEYKRIFSERQQLASESTRVVEDVMRRRNLVAREEKLASELVVEAGLLEKRACQRTRANGLRDELKANLENMDAENAEKFFPGALDQLKDRCRLLLQEPDENFLQNQDAMFSELASFGQKLNEALANWRREKADAEDSMRQLDSMSDFSLVGPVEYYNDEENGARTQLFDFLKKYANIDKQGEYQALREKLHQAYAEENFALCRSVAAEARQILDHARGRGIQLQQAMIEKTELAGALQDAMEKLGYETDLEIVDDNPDHGFRLFCKSGDEQIDFDNIDISDDGNIIIKLDHREAIGGGCKASWKTISQTLRQAGIPVTDVRMRGDKSVLFDKPKVSQQKDLQTQSHI